MKDIYENYDPKDWDKVWTPYALEEELRSDIAEYKKMPMTSWSVSDKWGTYYCNFLVSVGGLLYYDGKQIKPSDLCKKICTVITKRCNGFIEDFEICNKNL